MDDYISRAELLKEIENTTWDTEGDKAEAHYIATQIEPACIVVRKQACLDEEVDDAKNKE